MNDEDAMIPVTPYPGVLNVLAAIDKIRQELSKVAKDMLIETRKGSYRVLSHTSVLSACRDIMIKNGILLVPEYMTNLERRDGVTTVGFVYRVYHVGSGESISLAVPGQGADQFDKGAGMASTYADKYAMIRLFDLISADDPDATSNDEHEKTFAATNEVSSMATKLYNYVDKEFRMSRIQAARHTQLRDKIAFFENEKNTEELKKMVEAAGL